MAYELWDTETRNIIGAYEIEGDALDVAHQLIAANRAVYPDALAFVFEDDQGDTLFIASGCRLHALTQPQGPLT